MGWRNGEPAAIKPEISTGHSNNSEPSLALGFFVSATPHSACPQPRGRFIPSCNSPVRSMTDDRVMSAASYTGAGISVLSGLTLTDVGIIVGIATAILTFVANMVWQARKDRRERELNELLKRQAKKALDT